MPGTQVVAVIRLLRVTGCGPEVACVSRGSATVILVIARRGAGAAFETAPRGAVTVSAMISGSIWASQMSRGEGRTRTPGEQLGRGLRAGQSIAAGDHFRPAPG